MQFFQQWVVKLLLTLAMEAEKKGILKKYKIELLVQILKQFQMQKIEKNLEKI